VDAYFKSHGIALYSSCKLVRKALEFEAGSNFIVRKGREEGRRLV